MTRLALPCLLDLTDRTCSSCATPTCQADSSRIITTFHPMPIPSRATRQPHALPAPPSDMPTPYSSSRTTSQAKPHQSARRTTTSRLQPNHATCPSVSLLATPSRNDRPPRCLPGRAMRHTDLSHAQPTCPTATRRTLRLAPLRRALSTRPDTTSSADSSRLNRRTRPEPVITPDGPTPHGSCRLQGQTEPSHTHASPHDKPSCVIPAPTARRAQPPRAYPAPATNRFATSLAQETCPLVPSHLATVDYPSHLPPTHPERRAWLSRPDTRDTPSRAPPGTTSTTDHPSTALPMLRDTPRRLTPSRVNPRDVSPLPASLHPVRQTTPSRGQARPPPFPARRQANPSQPYPGRETCPTLPARATSRDMPFPHLLAGQAKPTQVFPSQETDQYEQSPSRYATCQAESNHPLETP
jgi:hypothetical protein